MSTLCRLCAHVKQFSRPICASKDVCRTLLSDAYRCHDAWMNRLQSPILSKVAFNEFILDVYNKFEKGKGNILDLDILANKIENVHDKEVEFMDRILQQFRETPDGSQVSRSIIHGIVRGYIDSNLTDSLLPMIKDKITYGLHLDFLSANILMDHFIKKEMYHEASQVAYDMMLQEDFSNQVTYLLSLYSTTKLLYHPIEQESPNQEAEEGEEEEEEWEAVKVIDYPFYDDHFSIQSERFLHGKTLYMLGKKLGGVDGRSLQLVGLGMYDKFPQALKLLQDWMSVSDGTIVVQDVVTRFDELLQKALTRDSEEPEKDFGLLRIEDEIHKLKLTQTEKEHCIKDWQGIKERLQSENKISSDDLETNISDYVNSEISQYEQSDITELKSLIESWETRRQNWLDQQMKDFIKQQKMDEIQEKIIELEEKEELLSYYTYENEIKLAGLRAPIPHKEPKKKKVLDEDEIEERKLADQKKRKIKKK